MSARVRIRRVASTLRAGPRGSRLLTTTGGSSSSSAASNSDIVLITADRGDATPCTRHRASSVSLSASCGAGPAPRRAARSTPRGRLGAVRSAGPSRRRCRGSATCGPTAAQRCSVARRARRRCRRGAAATGSGVDVPRPRNRTVGFGHHRVHRHAGAPRVRNTPRQPCCNGNSVTRNTTAGSSVSSRGPRRERSNRGMRSRSRVCEASVGVGPASGLAFPAVTPRMPRGTRMPPQKLVTGPDYGIASCAAPGWFAFTGGGHPCDGRSHGSRQRKRPRSGPPLTERATGIEPA